MLLIACCAWHIGLCVLTCVLLVITTMYYIHFQTTYIPDFNMVTMVRFFPSHLSWLHHWGEGQRDQSRVGKVSLLSLKNTKLALCVILATQALTPHTLITVVEQVPGWGATWLNWNGLVPNSRHHSMCQGLWWPFPMMPLKTLSLLLSGKAGIR